MTRRRRKRRDKGGAAANGQSYLTRRRLQRSAPPQTPASAPSPSPPCRSPAAQVATTTTAPSPPHPISLRRARHADPTRSPPTPTTTHRLRYISPPRPSPPRLALARHPSSSSTCSFSFRFAAAAGAALRVPAGGGDGGRIGGEAAPGWPRLRRALPGEGHLPQLRAIRPRSHSGENAPLFTLHYTVVSSLCFYWTSSICSLHFPHSCIPSETETNQMQGEDLLVTCYYIDCGMNAYAISPAQVPPSLFDCYLPRVYVLHVVSAALASISFAGICVLFIIFILVDVAPDYCHTTLLTYSVCCIPRTSSFTILSSTFYSRLLLMFYFYCFITVQLYSNTPSDFDFKLERSGYSHYYYLFSLVILLVHFYILNYNFHYYSLAQGFQSLFDFAQHLAANVDIVFPVIHGKFGEDGGIQVTITHCHCFFLL